MHSDERLVEEAQEQRAAFAELYHRHADRIYRYALARLGNPQDAQDITAQTFLAALEGLKHFQGRGTFAAWITGIARHKIHDHFRHRPNLLSLDEDIETTDSSPPLDEVVDDRLWLDHVQQQIHKLPAARAEALTLRIFAGLSAAEVAQIMGKSEDAVRMLVRRAITDLQEEVEKS
jgi:RNA polymerase sigma-70 factor (ECF subfamily)